MKKRRYCLALLVFTVVFGSLSLMGFGKGINVHAETEGMIRAMRNYDARVVRTGSGVSAPWSLGAAAPSVVEYKGKIYLYFRGEKQTQDAQGESYTTSLPYVFEYDPASGVKFDGMTWPVKNNEPVLGLGAPGELDDSHIMSLATYVFDDTIYLFYRGTKYKGTKDVNGNREYTHTLLYATSTDGKNFVKQGRVRNGSGYFTSATVVSTHVVDRTVYMTYRGKEDMGCYLTYSTDGGQTWAQGKRIIERGQDGSWDSHALDTFRMYNDDDYLYITFGGHFAFDDYPEGFNIARVSLKKDAMEASNWEVYPYGPILIRGASGAADEGAMWSLTPFRYGNKIYAFYEGAGTGTLEQGTDASAAARLRSYGGYRKTSFSNVMLCTFDADDFAQYWNATPQLGSVKIRNVATQQFLAQADDVRIIPSSSGDNFSLVFQNNFFQIRGNNDVAIAPSAKGAVTDSSQSSITYDSSVTSAINLMETAGLNYRNRRGVEWELYPVGDNVYKIQNRYTGNFLSIVNGSVVQSQETNAQNILWEIIALREESPTGGASNGATPQSNGHVEAVNNPKTATEHLPVIIAVPTILFGIIATGCHFLHKRR